MVLLRLFHDHDHPSGYQGYSEVPEEVRFRLDPVRKGGAIPVLPGEFKSSTDNRIFQLGLADSREVHFLGLDFHGVYCTALEALRSREESIWSSAGLLSFH